MASLWTWLAARPTSLQSSELAEQRSGRTLSHCHQAGWRRSTSQGCKRDAGAVGVTFSPGTLLPSCAVPCMQGDVRHMCAVQLAELHRHWACSAWYGKLMWHACDGIVATTATAFGLCTGPLGTGHRKQGSAPAFLVKGTTPSNPHRSAQVVYPCGHLLLAASLAVPPGPTPGSLAASTAPDHAGEQQEAQQESSEARRCTTMPPAAAGATQHAPSLVKAHKHKHSAPR